MQPHSQTPASLPKPDAASLQHSERVAQRLRDAMRAHGGSISFAQFMQLVLYEPGLGYYAAGAAKFGAEGDFVTAPEVSSLFGQVVALQCVPVLRKLPGCSILELGAGSGALAEDVLRALQEEDALPDRYLILEVSPDLQQRQRRRLQTALPDLIERVTWLAQLPSRLHGVVIANEVADALPVERFEKTATGVAQHRVAEQAGRLVWQVSDAPAWLSAAVMQLEDSLGRRLPTGYVSEISPGLKGWIADIADCVEEGLLLFFDYGIARREYYAADRNGGWLRCHFRHRVHADPLLYPGLQDLSSWVDFTAVAEAAHAAGLTVGAWLSQAHFMLHGGLLEALQRLATDDLSAAAELSRQVKMLTLPDEMGEHFKCMALTRGAVALPDDLLQADRSHAL